MSELDKILAKQKGLKSCPFCNNKKYLPSIYYDRSVNDSYIIQCENCCASGSTGYHKNEAIKSWNKRPREALLEKICKELLNGINKTLEANGHLADGDDCTLIDLKIALENAEKRAGGK